jgi:hypothetical protein
LTILCKRLKLVDSKTGSHSATIVSILATSVLAAGVIMDYRYCLKSKEAVLTTGDEDTAVKFRPCDFSREIQSLKLDEAWGFEGIPNELVRHIPKPLKVLVSTCNHRCRRLDHFLAPWQEARTITLPKPNISQKYSDQPLVYQDTLFQKLIL